MTISGALSANMTKRAYLLLKTLFWKNSRSLMKIAKKWCAQYKNEKTFSSRVKNFCSVQTPALCWKPLKRGVPSA